MEKERGALTPEQIQEELNKAMLSGDIERQNELLALINENEFQEMTADYLKEFPLDETKYLFKGFKMVNLPSAFGGTSDAPTECAVLQNEGGEFISAATVLMNTLRKVTTLPAPLIIKGLGKVEGKNNTYQKLKIKVPELYTK